MSISLLYELSTCKDTVMTIWSEIPSNVVQRFYSAGEWSRGSRE